jgi:AAA domain, putative AbiEii toxin, Type IV TA system
MLQRLKLQNVGPAQSLDIEFSPRVNLITGDNGLGKSFLLDIAWWALTSHWAYFQADPYDRDLTATITFSYGAPDEEVGFSAASDFDREDQKWKRPRGITPAPGLVIHARADGGISVWDPARNTRATTSRAVRLATTDRIPAYVFSWDEIWNGKFPKKGSTIDRNRPICNGLIEDWAFWQKDKDSGVEMKQLEAVLLKLSPAGSEHLRPGPLVEVGINDVRRMPTLRMPYGQNVPLVHASAAMQRIVALAYMLVWTWREHLRVSKIRNQPASNEIIFLIDEIEAHFHPAWQRRILRALMDVTKALMDSERVQVQIIAVTHSPMILASMEPVFDPNRDSLWKFDLVEAEGRQEVVLAKDRWHRRGDASAWLESDVFDLRTARSEEADNAMDDARKFMTDDKPDKQTFDRIYLALRQSLPGMDPFWIEWRAWGFRHKLLDGQTP